MILSDHYDASVDLLVTRHGGHFEGAEAQKIFVNIAQENGRSPANWIVDVREVASATFIDADIAYLGHTERELVRANQGDFRLNVVIVAHPEEDHTVNQRLRKMLTNAQVALSSERVSFLGFVSDWAEALAALELPETTKRPA